MDIGRILKFLIAGIVAGAILFFAGFGVINLLNKSPDAPVVVQTEPEAIAPVVNPPIIEISSDQTDVAVVQSSSEKNSQTTQQGTSDSPIKIKPLNTDGSDSLADAIDETTPDVSFGTLTLSTINSVNGAATNASFLIENTQNVAIALVKDTSTSTLSLPAGDYKITVSQGEQKVVRFLGVKSDKNGSEVFELDVPILSGEVLASEPPQEVATTTTTNTTESSESAVTSENFTQLEVPDDTSSTNNSVSTQVGGLRLSALTQQDNRPLAVSFTIQRANGETLETIQNVKTHQLSLPAGNYTVIANTDKSTTTKQVEVLATQGIHAIFLLPDQSSANNQQTAPAVAANPSQTNTPVSPSITSAPSVSASAQNNDTQQAGKLELFAQMASNNSPIKSNFYVQMPNGTMVTSKTYVDSIGYKLPVGQYKVIVRATGFKNKSIMLTVRAGKTRREIFKLEALNQAPTPAVTQNTTSAFGGLTVNVVAASDRSALPADIVIMQRDGTPLKQVYGVASASFDLPPREFFIRVTYAGLTTNHQVNIVKGKLAIKTISIDTIIMPRQ